ncbi:MAG: hypothetical protein FWF70_01980 [Bacteroidetes bacterium]|nr:hypothetical protein [Bacteroidota bacterium]MCL1967996.1 hypothetical protein [Bacteroidota bacterium]
MIQKHIPISLLIVLLLLVACNSSRHSQPVVDVIEPVEYPVGYIAQYLSTDLYDTTELYPLPEEFLENFMQVHTQYDGRHPLMTTEFPREWGVVLVERLPEGRELYQIQSQNREWIFLVITSGFGTQRILDLLPVAVNLAYQTEDVIETEIWTTDREMDGTFSVIKKYEWKRSLEKVTQREYEDNPKEYFNTQTVTDKYFINDFYRFERIIDEDTPDYSALIFYYKDEKPENYEDVVPMLQAFCEDYSILFDEVKDKFNQLDLYDYKLNYIITLDITSYMDFQEGFIFIKKGESPKTVLFGSYERLKIEIKRYFRIVET